VSFSFHFPSVTPLIALPSQLGVRHSFRHHYVPSAPIATSRPTDLYRLFLQERLYIVLTLGTISYTATAPASNELRNPDPFIYCQEEYQPPPGSATQTKPVLPTSLTAHRIHRQLFDQRLPGTLPSGPRILRLSKEWQPRWNSPWHIPRLNPSAPQARTQTTMRTPMRTRPRRLPPASRRPLHLHLMEEIIRLAPPGGPPGRAP
jgi:hypothetical protein